MKERANNIPQGIGIRVWYYGVIHEGYFKYGELDGRGRGIFYNGKYYIGEWKEYIRNGEGIDCHHRTVQYKL